MRNGKGFLWIAGLSVVLLGVAGRRAQVGRPHDPAAQPAAESDAASLPAGVVTTPAATGANRRPGAQSTTPTGRPSMRVFDWRQVESADYRTYVANLRSIGCPEQTIRDLVTADLQQAFAARRREVLAPHVRTNFWEAADRSTLARERRAVDEEFGNALRQVLGAEVAAPVAAAEWRAAEMELQLGFLPAQSMRRRV